MLQLVDATIASDRTTMTKLRAREITRWLHSDVYKLATIVLPGEKCGKLRDKAPVENGTFVVFKFRVTMRGLCR